MSANTTTPTAEPTAEPALPPFYKRPRFWKSAAPFLFMALAFLVGMVIVSALNGKSAEKGIPLEPNPPAPKTVHYSKAEIAQMHKVITKFVLTAVGRRHLAESW